MNKKYYLKNSQISCLNSNSVVDRAMIVAHDLFFPDLELLDSVSQGSGSVASSHGGEGLLYIQPSTSGLTLIPHNHVNLNHVSPVISNDVQRNKQLVGRYVLSELACFSVEFDCKWFGNCKKKRSKTFAKRRKWQNYSKN